MAFAGASLSRLSVIASVPPAACAVMALRALGRRVGSESHCLAFQAVEADRGVECFQPLVAPRAHKVYAAHTVSAGWRAARRAGDGANGEVRFHDFTSLKPSATIPNVTARTASLCAATLRAFSDGN